MTPETPSGPRFLLIGYGNPGRQDDGLGPALAEAVGSLCLPLVTVDSDYQLMVDDAVAFQDHDVVVLVDAALTGPEPFSVARVHPRPGASFTSHGVDGPELVALARDLFDAEPSTYQVAIRGYQFDTFEEKISPRALLNLDAALRFLEDVLGSGDAEALERCSLGSDGGASPCAQELS